jgi:RNA polymerase sigma factor (TIGR02999 family)
MSRSPAQHSDNRWKSADGDAGTITRILARASADTDGLAEVIPLVYDELSVLARSYLRHERDNHTLDTRALVHEVYERLAKQRGVVWRNRRHFFGIAAQHMRRILCDYARKHTADKRGGANPAIRLHGLEDLVAGESGVLRLHELLTLDQVFERLGKRDMEALEIVHLRCILGFKMIEVSRETGLPVRTLSRKWRWIRAWLISELRTQESQPPL